MGRPTTRYHHNLNPCCNPFRKWLLMGLMKPKSIKYYKSLCATISFFLVGCVILLLRTRHPNHRSQTSKLIVPLVIDPDTLLISNFSSPTKNNSDSIAVTDKAPLNATENSIIYTCGWSRGDRFYQYLFPEYRHRETLPLNITPDQANSTFLVHGFQGPCPGNRNEGWIANNWKGKALIINTEGGLSIGQIPSTLNRIGYEPDSNNSVHVLVGLLLVVTDTRYALDHLSKLIDPTKKPMSSGKFFCIYAHSNCVRYREDAADMLSTQVAPVYKSGNCRGTNGTLLLDHYQKNKKGWQNVNLFSEYRFCIVMENAKLKGYITEKIINAFTAGCIPIYYGTEEIFEVFNRKAFVFWNILNPEASVQQVMYLEQNKSAYRAMLEEEPILADGNNTIRNYFSFADHIGGGLIKRKIRRLVGLPE